MSSNFENIINPHTGKLQLVHKDSYIQELASSIIPDLLTIEEVKADSEIADSLSKRHSNSLDHASGSDNQTASEVDTTWSGVTVQDILSALPATYESKLPATPENPDNKFLDGNKTWKSIAIGAGGYAGNLYFTTQNSDVSGYKKISYTNEVTETVLTAIVKDQELLLRTYLYDSILNIDTIDAGIWIANYNAKIDDDHGVTQLKMEVFVRHIDNSETTLWSDYSGYLTNLDYAIIRSESNQPAFNVALTDRLGVRIYAKTTHQHNVTINTKIGDGDASYFTTPLAIRHNQLRDLNGDTAYQHINSTDRTNLNNLSGINSGDQTADEVSTSLSGISVQDAIDAINNSSYKLANRIIVGQYGQFDTLAEAVSWFNANATENTEILLDTGHHLISDTIVIDNDTYSLQIRGIGSAVTYLNANTGLTGKPMFNVKSPCDFNKLTADGATLANYGTLSNENFVTFNTTEGIYSEITDALFYNFKVGIADLIGTELFIFNFIFENCEIGIQENYSTEIANSLTLDAEVGSFINCNIGIDLLHSYSALKSHGFMLTHLIFEHSTSNQVGIKYTGTTFYYNHVANILNCSYNETGELTSGFDFTLQSGRDANIKLIGNIGEEDATPHAKINVVDNTTTTTITTAGTYYKCAGINSKPRIVFNNAATAGTFTITVFDQTTSAIAYNASTATIKSAIEALNNVTTVTVTQVVASKEWTIEFVTSGEGFVPMTVNISGLTTTTAYEVIASFYTQKLTIGEGKVTFQSTHKQDGMMWISGNLSVNQTNRNVNIGLKKNNTGQIIAPFTVRTSTSGQVNGFSFNAYVDDMTTGDYYELFVTSSSNGDVVTVSDLCWLIDTK